jgi:hypothetical protein
VKTIRLHPTRRRVYELLVDGAAPGAGLAPTSIIDLMNAEGKISEQRVYQIIREMRGEGYVRKIPGTSLYTRGRDAAVLDDLIEQQSKQQVNTSHGGGPIAHYPSKEDNIGPKTQIFETYVPTAETHICGIFIYPVLRVGEVLEQYRVRDPDTREVSEVRVFKEEPKLLNNGVAYFQGIVPLDDRDVKVQYWQGPAITSMHIWPRPVRLLPGRAAESREELAEAAQRVANWLGRFGGWKFGQPSFVPNEKGEDAGYHYATNDKVIMDQLPLDFQPAAETGWRIDSTPGPRALETNSEENINALLNVGPITRELRAGQKDLGQRQQLLAEQIEQVRTQNLEMILEIHQDHNMILRSALEGGRIRDIERDTRQEANGTVMYQ